MVSNLAPPRDTEALVRKIIWLVLAAVVVADVAWYAVLALDKSDESAPPAAGAGQLAREDSHRLTSPAVEKAQLVEFHPNSCQAK